MVAENSVSILLLVVVGCWACRGCLGQIPIPARTDGFVYGGKPPAWGQTVVVEAFFDPVCPDSRDAWPAPKKAVEHYGLRRCASLPAPLPQQCIHCMPVNSYSEQAESIIRISPA